MPGGGRVKVFWDPVQLRHAPRFFLQRGLVRQNFEIPDRALALLEGVTALGLTTQSPPEAPMAALETVHSAAYLDFLRTAPAAWAKLPDAGPEVVANIHPSPEMLANGARPSTVVIAQAGQRIGALGLPAAIVQEGGYNVDVIGNLLERFLTAYAG